MPVLQTVNKSPFERNALLACLRMAQPGSSVLLIEDGVYAALRGTSISDTIVRAMQVLSFYALAPDLQARGCAEDRLIEGVKTVDYKGFVDLVVAHDCVQAWL